MEASDAESSAARAAAAAERAAASCKTGEEAAPEDEAEAESEVRCWAAAAAVPSGHENSGGPVKRSRNGHVGGC